MLDVNGTLSRRGELIDGVADRLAVLANDLRCHLLTADTFGTAEQLGQLLGAEVTRILDGTDKAVLVNSVGGEATVAIGNGRNDVAMFDVARPSIAVLGPEGASPPPWRPWMSSRLPSQMPSTC